MSTLQQLREEMTHAWDRIVEGWGNIYRRASGALTRFTPGAQKGESNDAERQELVTRSSGWGLLAAEVFDDDDRVVVRLEVPGLDTDDFDLQVIDDYLVVRGEKRVVRERTQGRYHVSECAYGRFERAIPLPEEVDSGAASAGYKDGVLRVELPKSTPRRRRTIQIDVR
jgi:HSP20 family protein